MRGKWGWKGEEGMGVGFSQFFGNGVVAGGNRIGVGGKRKGHFIFGLTSRITRPKFLLHRAID